ncbi:hypothetical protein HDU85_002008 [Gaertneriomyces sp. JEL0708]|nr:hypothetical protein HDU85_002008 [Gaertneriomyces sp. JEL0708]
MSDGQEIVVFTAWCDEQTASDNKTATRSNDVELIRQTELQETHAIKELDQTVGPQTEAPSLYSMRTPSDKEFDLQHRDSGYAAGSLDGHPTQGILYKSSEPIQNAPSALPTTGVMDSFWSATLSVFRGPGGSPLNEKPRESRPGSPWRQLSNSSIIAASKTSQAPEILPLQLPVKSLTPSNTITCIARFNDALFLGTEGGMIFQSDIPTDVVSPRSFGDSSHHAVTALACTHRRLFAGYHDGALRSFSLSPTTSGSGNRSIAAAHTGPITAICVTEDKRLYTSGEDGSINEWDPRSLRRKWILPGHRGRVNALCTSGGKVFSSGEAGEIHVWDMSTGRCVATYQDHNEHILALCLGRDLLYSAARDGIIKVVDTSTGQCLRSLNGHNRRPVRAICLAKGKLYSAGDDGAILEWDVKAAKILRTISSGEGSIVGLTSGGHGKLLYASAEEGVKFWDIAGGTLDSVTAAENSVRDSAPPSPPLSPHLHASFAEAELRPADSVSNRPDGTESVVSSHDVVPTADEVVRLRAQLTKAQDVAAKHTRQSVLLKSELNAARAEVKELRSQLQEAQESILNVADLENELAAAKELLVSYKTELHMTQEAYQAALDYLRRCADRNWLEIEKDIDGLQCLVQQSAVNASDLFVAESLEKFMPPRKIDRAWDLDSEFDSDVDLDGGYVSDVAPGTPIEAGRVVSTSDMVDKDENQLEEHSTDDDATSDILAPSVIVKAHRVLPDGSILITADSRAPSPTIVVDEFESTSATPSKGRRPSSDYLPPARALNPTHAATAARLLRAYSPDPSKPGVYRDTVSGASSWFKPLQSWVEHLGESFNDPRSAHGGNYISGETQTTKSTLSAISEDASTTSRPAVVRVRQKDVYRFDEGADQRNLLDDLDDDLASIVRSSASVKQRPRINTPNRESARRQVRETAKRMSGPPDSAIDMTQDFQQALDHSSSTHKRRVSSHLEKVANVLENVVEDPWSLVSGWIKRSNE